MARDRVTDEEVDRANGVLQRYYAEWVEQIARGIAEQVLSGDIEDYDRLVDALHENIDGQIIYTKDQYLVIYAASGRSASEGSDQAHDTGSEGAPEQTLAAWAYFTLEADVQSELSNFGLQGDFDRVEWIREVLDGRYGAELPVLWDKLVLRDPSLVDVLKDEDDE